MTYWVIVETDSGLFWSNDDGWVDLASATRFTTGERYSLQLPIGGNWLHKEDN